MQTALWDFIPNLNALRWEYCCVFFIDCFFVQFKCIEPFNTERNYVNFSACFFDAAAAACALNIFCCIIPQSEVVFQCFHHSFHRCSSHFSSLSFYHIFERNMQFREASAQFHANYRAHSTMFKWSFHAMFIFSSCVFIFCEVLHCFINHVVNEKKMLSWK